MTSTLDRIQAWFRSRCDGEWEHSEGIQIGTLDNPGWQLSINLSRTPLQGVAFADYEDQYEHPTDWLRAWKEGTAFQAACGPGRLESALIVFLDWAERAER